MTDLRQNRLTDALGPSPACTAGDRLTALDYLHSIERAIGTGTWTAREREKLTRLRKKWSRRAFGKDARFELVGTRGGRLPAEVEYRVLGPARRKQRIAEIEEEKLNGRKRKTTLEQLQAWQDADLPPGSAKGGGNGVDPDADVWEPEPGEIALPKQNPRQYLIPGQDNKGHAHRVYCRIMPAHYRALSALERSKQFGFRTMGDVMRWCIDYGVRELTMRAKLPQATSALAQVDAIREILLDEQYYLEFPQIFEQMTTTINRHLSAGATMEAVRLVATVRHQIECMGEEYWREKYFAQLMSQFGHLLENAEAEAVSFGG